MYGVPSVDLGLMGEVAQVINPQLKNHVEKDVAPWKRKKIKTLQKFWLIMQLRKAKKWLYKEFNQRL